VFSTVDGNAVMTYRSAKIVLDIWRQCPPTKSELEISCALKEEIYEIVLCVMYVRLPVSSLPQITGSVSTKFATGAKISERMIFP